MVTLWGDGAATAIDEGTALRITNLSPSSSYEGATNLAVTDSTRIEPIKGIDMSKVAFTPRKLSALHMIADEVNASTGRVDFDVVICVVAILDLPEGRQLYMADGNSMTLMQIAVHNSSKQASKQGVGMPWTAKVGQVWAICNLTVSAYGQSVGVLYADWSNRVFATTAKMSSMHGMSLRHTFDRLNTLRLWAGSSTGIGTVAFANCLAREVQQTPPRSLRLRMPLVSPTVVARVMYLTRNQPASTLPLTMTVESGDRVVDLGLSFYGLWKMLSTILNWNKDTVGTEIALFVQRNAARSTGPASLDEAWHEANFRTDPVLSASLLAVHSSAESDALWDDLVQICGLIPLRFTLSCNEVCACVIDVSATSTTDHGNYRLEAGYP